MRKIIVFLALVFLLSVVVPCLSVEETRLIYDLGDWEGLDVKIWAPWQGYPNETMTIRIIVEAGEDLQDATVTFKIYGSESDGFLLWLRRLDALKNVDLPLGAVEDQYFDVNIPDSVDPGLLHALITCSWQVWRGSSWEERTIDDWHIPRVTYLRNKPYEDLQVAYDQLLADFSSLRSSYDQLLENHNSLQTSYNDLGNSYTSLQANYNTLLTNHNNLHTNYDSLNSTYYSLLSDYASLQSSFNELKAKYEFGGETASTLNLMYVFIETTVIFIATTIYFARGRAYPAPHIPKQQN